MTTTKNVFAAVNLPMRCFDCGATFLPLDAVVEFDDNEQPISGPLCPHCHGTNFAKIGGDNIETLK